MRHGEFFLVSLVHMYDLLIMHLEVQRMKLFGLRYSKGKLYEPTRYFYFVEPTLTFKNSGGLIRFCCQT